MAFSLTYLLNKCPSEGSIFTNTINRGQISRQMQKAKSILAMLALLFVFVLLPSISSATGSDSLKRNSAKAYGFPIVFYSPETNGGAGGLGILTFHLKHDTAFSPPSKIQLGAAYTIKKQILFYVPYQLYLKGGKYSINGELGYYKYFYNFFGIGRSSAPNQQETYGVTYPRVRVNLLKRVTRTLFLGAKYSMDDFTLTSFDPKGELIKGDILGSHGGRVSGIGGVALYDSRDNSFSPAKGYLGEGFVQYFGPGAGSIFEYTQLGLDVSKYIQVGKEQVFALNGHLETTFGNPPFYEMALLGGSKHMRGYYEGRYRDKNIVVFQAEYRIALFWRLGAVFFGGVGEVYKTWQEFNTSNILPSYGTGLRFMLDTKQKINIRLDAGFGKNTSGYYFTIGEAF
jgi:hypothetical protein